MRALEDPHEFARAYRDHAGRVRASAMRVLKDPGRADDVAQEVFERLWRDPGRYDARRGELGSYLQLVARSRALDAWRADAALGRATDRLQTVSARDETAAEDHGPAQIAERRETGSRLRELLRLLPPLQREAIVLSYWGGLSSAEIARATRVPLGTAKSRLRLAHEKLRELWTAPTSTAATSGGP
jgi:RNA polymerase sigma-70 factor (ECF subfamily)